jgi:hypothetical protein
MGKVVHVTLPHLAAAWYSTMCAPVAAMLLAALPLVHGCRQALCSSVPFVRWTQTSNPYVDHVCGYWKAAAAT